MGKARSLYAIVVVACCACKSSSGSGILTSGEGGDDDTAAAIILTTTAAGSLCTTGGLLTTAETKDQAPSLWLQNRRDIEVSIARGNGIWIDDLASELTLPVGLVPHLGEALKRHQQQLAERLRDKVKTDDWERLLADALCCDPWIYPFARQRFQCRSAAESLVKCEP